MDFLTLKHDLDTNFALILDSTTHGELPGSDVVAEFVRLCRTLHIQAEEDWNAEAEDFAHLAVKLQQAVKRGNVQEAVMIVDSLDAAKDYCHRTFSM
ncbi:XXXCH domain-containing protein [Desulfobaculum xiamenense]|uniref:XXXCH domain-containing protein n=1 Tax=Desulfobaculum xiamenense TaxID=995050 RepID=A0A846QNX6_9BACT|nr:GAK system XXXCH domain-containing protein [Desulfobaculum xiamenense]NJB67983.1 XXXCH domain-containing protein [Desulfobaculum xiamenense]